MSESNYVINELYADGPRRFKRHNYKGHKNRRAKKVRKMTGLSPPDLLKLANPTLSEKGGDK